MLGAIKEERGEINGMQNLINYYKKQHSRKRHFVYEKILISLWILVLYGIIHLHGMSNKIGTIHLFDDGGDQK